MGMEMGKGRGIKMGMGMGIHVLGRDKSDSHACATILKLSTNEI